MANRADPVSPRLCDGALALDSAEMQVREKDRLDRHAEALATLAGAVRRAFIKGARDVR